MTEFEDTAHVDTTAPEQDDARVASADVDSVVAAPESSASEQLESSGAPDVGSDEPRAVAGEPEFVTAARRDLAGLGEQDLADHPAVYERIHTQLRDALSGIGDA